MRCYFLLIFCFNYIGVYSKNYIIHMPALSNPHRMLEKVISIIEPLHTLSGTRSRDIDIYPAKNPLADSVHTTKPPDQKTAPPIARAKAVMARRTGGDESDNNNKGKDETERKVANKDDLDKALSKLAEKAHKWFGKHKPAEKSEQPKQQPSWFNSGFKQPKVIKANNMDEVLQLMNKGGTFDKIHDLGSDKITWMKIKIPKKKQ